MTHYGKDRVLLPEKSSLQTKAITIIHEIQIVRLSGATYQVCNRPFPTFSKRVLVLILSYKNEISFTCKLNSLSYELLCTRPRFEREAFVLFGTFVFCKTKMRDIGTDLTYHQRGGSLGTGLKNLEVVGSSPTLTT